MTVKTYRAVLIEETIDGSNDREVAARQVADRHAHDRQVAARPVRARMAALTEAELSQPDGTVWVRVEYSSLNFKDALALAGNRGVAKVIPLVAGIDLVGTVTTSTDTNWRTGDQIILNGDGLGESRHGGLAERAHVRGTSLVRLPTGRSARWAATLGTAGFTAALAVLAVRDHGIRPTDGPILVTGAAGGVGSIAIALLAQAGYQVLASTGRAKQQADYLAALGASQVIERSELETAAKPLQKSRWAAVIDSVGSHTLANALAHTNYGGVVAACGMAQGIDLPATVMPFILRAVTLRGINSVDAPLPLRQRAWDYLAEVFAEDALRQISTEIALEEALQQTELFQTGNVRGRIVVRISG